MGQRSEQTLNQRKIQMANRHMKRCSVYVRKLQIKMMRYYTLVRKAKINNLDNMKC